jgi:hypothetical protein
LWHGTRDYDARLIANGDETLSLDHAKVGLYGKAVYFAVQASYSCSDFFGRSFSHLLKNGATLSDGSTVPNGTRLVIFSKV